MKQRLQQNRSQNPFVAASAACYRSLTLYLARHQPLLLIPHILHRSFSGFFDSACRTVVHCVFGRFFEFRSYIIGNRFSHTGISHMEYFRAGTSAHTTRDTGIIYFEFHKSSLLSRYIYHVEDLSYSGSSPFPLYTYSIPCAALIVRCKYNKSANTSIFFNFLPLDKTSRNGYTSKVPFRYSHVPL